MKQIVELFQSVESEMYTNAVPASATSAERKLKKRALETEKPDLTSMPKSPICKKYISQGCRRYLLILGAKDSKSRLTADSSMFTVARLYLT